MNQTLSYIPDYREEAMKHLGKNAMIIAGFIAGIAFVYSCLGGGSNSLAGTTVTDYYSIGDEGFHDYDPTDPSYGSYASVNLPHNSKIKSITGYFTDEFGPGSTSLAFLTLGRDGSTLNAQSLSTVALTTYGSVTLDYPDGLFIDNISNYYCFWWPNPTAPILFHSVFIEYEYTL
jgi:hypothetical protein